MKKIILNNLFILILGIILINIGCEPLDIKRVAKVHTGDVSEIGYFKATADGLVVDVSNDTHEIGHCWDTLSEPDINKNKQPMDGEFVQGSSIHTEMTFLLPDHTYYLRAYAMTGNETVYGDEITFTTKKLPNYKVNILSPLDNSQWPIGKQKTISWQSDMPGEFILTLRNPPNYSDKVEIATTADGVREFTYTLPSNLVVGDKYAIVVQNVALEDFYDLKFIYPTDPSISAINEPNANTKWNVGRDYDILWESTGVDRVDIKLYKDGNWLSDIVGDQPNSNNKQPWTPELTLAPGTGYQLKINYTGFPEINFTSSNFEILPEAYVNISAPANGNTWQMGSTHDITWTDNIEDNVKIVLNRAGGYLRDINLDTESDGSYSWTLPTDLSANADYSIMITSVDDAGISAESEQFTISAAATTGTVTDFDGNTYNTVKIGNQWWMAENLKVTKYADGSAIGVGEVTDNTTWANLGDNNTDKAYCYYNNNASNEADTYGALYTWAAAMNGASSSTANPSGVQGVCPTGWHVPSDAEWKELEMQLGMTQAQADGTGWRGTNEGSKLAGNASLWTNGNLDANAEFGASGFSGLPGGYRNYVDGAFYIVGSIGYWWSATENSGTQAWDCGLDYNHSDVGRASASKSHGLSVRCVKD